MKQLVILITILSYCDSALACTCEYFTTTEHYSRAAEVFRARVESVDIVPVPNHLEGTHWLMPSARAPKGRVVQARFKLLETYKGSPQLLDAVYTSYSSSCGLDIYDGEEHVFFATTKGVVGLCDGSTRVWPDGNRFKDLIKSLKRLASEQMDHEKGLAAPESPGNE